MHHAALDEPLIALLQLCQRHLGIRDVGPWRLGRDGDVRGHGHGLRGGCPLRRTARAQSRGGRGGAGDSEPSASGQHAGETNAATPSSSRFQRVDGGCRGADRRDRFTASPISASSTAPAAGSSSKSGLTQPTRSPVRRCAGRGAVPAATSTAHQDPWSASMSKARPHPRRVRVAAARSPRRDLSCPPAQEHQDRL